MFAKRFFFVCAGLLCLAITYHLGARNAGAHEPSFMDCASFGDGYSPVAVVDRQLFYSDGRRIGDPVPGTSPVVACGANGVVLANGEAWRWGGSGWYLMGTFPGGPVPTKVETIGRLKARYRTGGER